VLSSCLTPFTAVLRVLDSKLAFCTLCGGFTKKKFGHALSDKVRNLNFVNFGHGSQGLRIELNGTVIVPRFLPIYGISVIYPHIWARAAAFGSIRIDRHPPVIVPDHRLVETPRRLPQYSLEPFAAR
jgi:hypothetical protein